jgi:hypothetical protein
VVLRHVHRFLLFKFLRRHLTPGQRAMIAAAIANMKSGNRTDLELSETSHEVSREEAAKQLGTTPKAISQARVIKEYAPEEAVKVAASKSVTTHVERWGQ